MGPHSTGCWGGCSIWTLILPSAYSLMACVLKWPFREQCKRFSLENLSPIVSMPKASYGHHHLPPPCGQTGWVAAGLRSDCPGQGRGRTGCPFAVMDGCIDSPGKPVYLNLGMCPPQLILKRDPDFSKTKLKTTL